LTLCHELRDVLYGFKKNKTFGWTDNGDVPSSWPLQIIDQALGCPVHGVATVLDSGAMNVDYLITTSWRGLELFNGRYLDPELSWKIQTFWESLERNDFKNIQIINDPIEKIFYIIMPDQSLMIADYNNGMTPKGIRWAPWTFDVKANTIAIVNTGQVIMGSVAAVDA